VDAETAKDAVAMVNKVMGTSHRLYARHARKAIHAGDISDPFAFGAKDRQDRVVELAQAELERIDALAPPHLPRDMVENIFENITGLLPELRQHS
jgi:hypothetical protein